VNEYKRNHLGQYCEACSAYLCESRSVGGSFLSLNRVNMVIVIHHGIVVFLIAFSMCYYVVIYIKESGEIWKTYQKIQANFTIFFVRHSKWPFAALSI
jgi:hypothetical protein